MLFPFSRSVGFLFSSKPKNFLSTNEIAQKFTNFFVDNNHKPLPSAPIVPGEFDQSLLFVNAGMVPLKKYFLGQDTPPHHQITSIQKCLRASGKHNDLEMVGFTERHHTFFEMLGNFTIGSPTDNPKSTKLDAIQRAWDFLVKNLGLDPERLAVSYFHHDLETRDLWVDTIGLDQNRVVPLGIEDNFWSTGLDISGPCGPCTEIYYNLHDSIIPSNSTIDVDDDSQWVEIWNIVFMQYLLHPENAGEKSFALPENVIDVDSLKVTPLDSVSVDTGMGLERLASIVQGKLSNYQSDLLDQGMKIILKGLCPENALKEWSPHHESTPDHIIGAKIIVDHLRCALFLIADGVVPGPSHRKYVLRRILRRAIYTGYKYFHMKKPFLSQFVQDFAKLYVTRYPNLENTQFISEIIHTEETQFFKLLLNGLGKLEMYLQQDQELFNAKSIVQLYDTFGLPIDFSLEIAKQNGIVINMKEVDSILNSNREKSLQSWVSNHQVPPVVLQKSQTLSLDYSSEFIGKKIKNHQCVVKNLSIIPSPDFDVNSSKENKNPSNNSPFSSEFYPRPVADPQCTAWMFIDKSPFYPQGGGQSSDIGYISTTINGNITTLPVLDCRSIDDLIVICVDISTFQNKPEMYEIFLQTQEFSAEIDGVYRNLTSVHHTATHLLNSELKKIFGNSVVQSGSFIGSDYFTFDFTCSQGLDSQMLKLIESNINSLCTPTATTKSTQVEFETMEFSDAIERGAVYLFGEMYDKYVSTVIVNNNSENLEPVSFELCGGTHVTQLSSIYPFIISQEYSVGAGVRRIVARAGVAAINFLSDEKHCLDSIGTSITPSSWIPAISSKKPIQEKNIKLLELFNQRMDDRQLSIGEFQSYHEFVGSILKDSFVSVKRWSNLCVSNSLGKRKIFDYSACNTSFGPISLEIFALDPDSSQSISISDFYYCTTSSKQLKTLFGANPLVQVVEAVSHAQNSSDPVPVDIKIFFTPRLVVALVNPNSKISQSSVDNLWHAGHLLSSIVTRLQIGRGGGSAVQAQATIDTPAQNPLEYQKLVDLVSKLELTQL